MDSDIEPANRTKEAAKVNTRSESEQREIDEFEEEERRILSQESNHVFNQVQFCKFCPH